MELKKYAAAAVIAAAITGTAAGMAVPAYAAVSETISDKQAAIDSAAKVVPSNAKLVGAKTDEADFDVRDGRFYLDGEDVETQLHTPAIDLWSSKISVIPEVRSIVNRNIHALTKRLSIIAEGRDMTTVVFPDAEYKFFFDAKPEVRAQRRFDQNPSAMPYERVLAEINERDQIDRNKPVGGLKIAPDAMYIDTSYLTINEVCDKVVKAIKGEN